MQGRELPVYELRRIDSRRVMNGALGLTYLSGEGAQVHVDRIRQYLLDSVLPATADGGGGAMFAFGAQADEATKQRASDAVRKSLLLAYERGSPARGALRRYANRALDNGGVELATYRQYFIATDHLPRSGQEPFPGPELDGISSIILRTLTRSGEMVDFERVPDSTLRPLLDAFTRSVVSHEASHLLWSRPLADTPPVATTLAYAALEDLEEPFRETVANEVAAYLVGLFNGDIVRPVLATQLASFALNVARSYSPEFHAARLILPVLRDARSARNAGGRPERCRDELGVREAYREIIEDGRLSHETPRDLDASLQDAAAAAYRRLFAADPPIVPAD